MKIAIVAPARPITPALAARMQALAALTAPRVDLVVHPQCFAVDPNQFAGTDAVRAAAFLEVANDPGIDAVWFARGGYGSNRILAEVMPRLSAAAGYKAYLGYSDMGFLLGALYARRVGRPTHGPMPIDLGRAGGDAAVTRALAWLVDRASGSLEPKLGGRPAAAFNLAILTALIGTGWLPDLTDHVLLIEEVSEPLYRIDRMLFQLAHAAQLKGIAGVRLGRISDVQANDPVFAESAQTMIERWAREMGVAYLGTADIGHDVANKVVPFGVA